MNRRQWLSMVAAALPAWRTVLHAQQAPAFADILKIDIHSHVFEDIPALITMLRRTNVRTMNVCNNGSDGHLETMHRIAVDLFRKHPDLFPFASTFDVTGVNEPGYPLKVIQWLNGTFDKGAIAVKVWVGSSRVDLQACKLEYSIVSPK